MAPHGQAKLASILPLTHHISLPPSLPPPHSQDSLYHEGKFCVEGVEGIPHGQAKLASMLAEGHDLLRKCLERVDFYKVRFRPSLPPSFIHSFFVLVRAILPLTVFGASSLTYFLPPSLPPSFLGRRAPPPLAEQTRQRAARA